MPALIALTAVCALTYSFEIVFGLGGTIMMLPPLAVLFDTKTLVVYSTLPQILVGSIGLLRSARTVDFRFLGPMLGFAAVGAAAGTALFYYIPLTLFQRLLAGIVTLSGLYLAASSGRLRLNRIAARGLDVLAGASQALFGISGPIAMARLLATFENKTVVRNYALAFFLALNILRLTGYAVNGIVSRQVVDMMLFSGPFLAFILWRANHLHRRVNETAFRRVVAWIIVVGGISLFLRRG